MRKMLVCTALLALVPLASCKTVSSATNGVQSAGSAVAQGVSSVPSLVNVNLSNVLNNLALDLHIDKANIPINAQIPISIAANICGVSINVLSIGTGGGSSKGCTAQTTSPQLDQAVQQQLAANGSVGGGAQSSSGTTGASTSTSSAPQQQPVTTQPATSQPQTSTTTPQS